MKKVFGMMILVALMTISVGCGSKKVECSMSDSDDSVGYTTTSKVVGTMNGDNISESKLTLTMEFEDATIAQNSYDILKQSSTDFDDIKIDGKKITITSSESYKDETLTKEDFIKSFEAEGYTCK